MSGSMTGGVDSSIPLQAGRGVPQPENLLATAGQFANTANALNQLKLFPGAQQLQQQAIQSGQIGIQSGQTSLLQQQLQSGYRSMAYLLNKDGPITLNDFTNAAAGYEAAGSTSGVPNISQPMIADVMTNAPSDPKAFDAWFRAKDLAGAQETGAGATRAVVGAPTTVNTGQAIQPGLIAPPGLPGGGAFTPAGGAIQQYPSRTDLINQVGRPATAQQAVELGVPIGTQLNETMLTRLQQQGAGALAGPAGASPGVTGVGGPVSPANPPRLTTTPPAAAAPDTSGGVLLAPPPAPPPIATSHGAVVSGFSPAVAAEYAASTGQYNEDNKASSSFQQRVFPLQQAAQALKNTDTGPGAETVNQVKSFLLAQTPESLQKYLPGVDPNKIANFDGAVKYLAQYAMNQPGAAQSDMHLGLAQTANASTHISNQAAQQIVMNTLGLERMKQAAMLQFNQEHPEAGSSIIYQRWLNNKFLPSQDPRGFSWDEQTQEQKQHATQGMTRQDKLRLLTSINLARDLKLTGQPGG
jgi:hypothetical protein